MCCVHVFDTVSCRGEGVCSLVEEDSFAATGSMCPGCTSRYEQQMADMAAYLRRGKDLLFATSGARALLGELATAFTLKFKGGQQFGGDESKFMSWVRTKVDKLTAELLLRGSQLTSHRDSVLAFGDVLVMLASRFFRHERSLGLSTSVTASAIVRDFLNSLASSTSPVYVTFREASTLVPEFKSVVLDALRRCAAAEASTPESAMRLEATVTAARAFVDAVQQLSEGTKPPAVSPDLPECTATPETRRRDPSTVWFGGDAVRCAPDLAALAARAARHGDEAYCRKAFRYAV